MTDYLHTYEDWQRRVIKRLTALERRKGRVGEAIAWATAAGVATVAATGITTVTFPAGRFTQAPIVHTTVQASAGGVVAVAFTNAAPTLTNFQVRIYSLGGAQVAGTVMWIAHQQTPTSATG